MTSMGAPSSGRLPDARFLGDAVGAEIVDGEVVDEDIEGSSIGGLSTRGAVGVIRAAAVPRTSICGPAVVDSGPSRAGDANTIPASGPSLCRPEDASGHTAAVSSVVGDVKCGAPLRRHHTPAVRPVRRRRRRGGSILPRTTRRRC
jgi:hypothetical protein